MLVIRNAQMRALELEKQHEFARATALRLKGVFPGLNARYPERELVAALHAGVARAHRHGLVSDHDVSRYLALMWCFGRDFDTDPAQPWASAALADAATPDASARIDRAYADGISRVSAGQGLRLEPEAAPVAEPPAEMCEAAEAADDFDAPDEDEEDDDHEAVS